MKSSHQDCTEQVLTEGKWLRGLALCLAHDRADAEDMVQETWLAALKAAPELREGLRPWLARVLHNARRKLRRADMRRRRREMGTSTLVADERVSSTETMLARLELQRMISALVRDLDEPYRTAVLLRFYEDRSPTEMARRLGIPAGTVRWRLNEALRRVRVQLDEAHGGNRDTWKAAVLVPAIGTPAAPVSTTSPAPAPSTPAPMDAGSSGSAPGAGTSTEVRTQLGLPGGASAGVIFARAAGIALVPALGAALFLGWSRKPADVPRAALALTAPGAQVQTQPASGPRAEDPRMRRLLGTVVPALVSAGEAATVAEPAPPPPATCDPAHGCVQTIPRAQLPPAAEASLVRLLAGRTPEELRLEPKIRHGHMTYKARFEVNGIDEEIDFAADGTFIEHQVQLTPADLPAPITALAKGAFPDGTIVKASMNNEADLTYYELVDGVPTGQPRHRVGIRWYGVRVRVGEQIHDLKVAEDGKLLEDKLR
jgi:RNA polymerase sigma-70 factor (ECF subfamily)